MTSRLSSDQVEQLTPVLGSLARLVASGSDLSDRLLNTLLLGTDLGAESVVMEEVKRWGELLRGLQQDSSEEQRRVTTEALMLRGLPEAPVLLAVSAVAEASPLPAPTPSAPPPGGKLKAIPESLDFGTLPSDESASSEIEVHGGPGHIEVGSDQVQVTPVEFGNTPTRIRVEVHPRGDGLLWSSIRLMTAGETLEVSVVAQWGDSLPSSPPVSPSVSSSPGVDAPFLLDPARQETALRTEKDLLAFCDDHWGEATGHFQSGQIEAFLNFIGNEEAAQTAVQYSVVPNENIGLERFLRETLKAKPPSFRANDFEVVSALGYGPMPRLFRKSDRETLRIEHSGKRGYLYGQVKPLVDWLAVPDPRFGCLPGEVAEVEIHVDKSQKKTGLLEQLLSGGEALFEIVTE